MIRATAAALSAAGLSAAGYRWLARRAPSPTWVRTNHAGREITLYEGPAFVGGAALGASFAGPGPAVAVLGSGAFGLLDDLAGDSDSKGLRGHLRAAAQGRITTGAIKIIGIGATGLVAATAIDARSGRVNGLDALLGGAVIAGGANLANLLDLRPGRALKAANAAGLVIAVLGNRDARTMAAALGGASAAVLAPDLRGDTMLGDTGANAAGALVASALVESTSRAGRLVALTGLTAAILASERVSYSAVIDANPVLRWVDRLGRTP